jgi:hypothetical protein
VDGAAKGGRRWWRQGNDRQCRTGLHLHRWGVRERREEMEVRTCTDRNQCRRQKAILIAATPRAGALRDAKLASPNAAGGAGRLQGSANRFPAGAGDGSLARHDREGGRLFGCLGLVEDCERNGGRPQNSLFQVRSQSLAGQI